VPKQNEPQIEKRAVESLVPYSNNARTHSDAQVAQIAASIKEFGWTNPILVDGENGIIAGHGRLMAARMLGLDEVPVIELAHLSDAQRRAYILADNKLAENAGWDKQLLKVEIGNLADEDIDLELTGFDADELRDLMVPDLGGDGDGSQGGEQQATVQYNIVFDDTDQQEVWFKFLRTLKVEYPDAETIAERLVLYIQEHEDG